MKPIITFLSFIFITSSCLLSQKKLNLENGGGISPSVCKMKDLEVFVNYGNDWDWSFSLPNCFYELKKLKRIEIVNSDLDTILPAIANLQELLYLEVVSNKLRSVPAEISYLKKLDTLIIQNYENRNLSFPKELGNISHLNYLKTYSFHISPIPNLVSLDMSADSLPDQMDGFKNLQHLRIEYYKCETLPSSIGKLLNLKHLYVSSDNITTFPSTVSDCKNLEALELKCTYLNDIPSSIGKLTQLKKLVIGGQFIGSIPAEITQCSLLDSLILREVWADSTYHHLSALTRLKYLSVETNHMPKLPGLISLNIHCDSVPLNLQYSTQLENLCMSWKYGRIISSTELDRFIFSLSQLRQLQTLELQSWGNPDLLSAVIKKILANVITIKELKELRLVILPFFTGYDDVARLRSSFPEIQFNVLEN